MSNELEDTDTVTDDCHVGLETGDSSVKETSRPEMAL